MAIQILDTQGNAREASPEWGFPSTLAGIGGAFAFGISAAASKRNRAIGKRAFPLIPNGAPVVSADRVALSGAANFYSSEVAFDPNGSFTLAGISRMPVAPATPPGATIDFPIFAGNYWAVPTGGETRGCAVYMSTYGAGPPATATLLGTMTFDVSGTATTVNSTLSAQANPTSFWLWVYGRRAGVDRGLWNVTGGTSVLNNDTRTPLTSTRQLRWGAASNNTVYGNSEHVNGLFIPNAGPTDALVAQIATALRLDAALVGITSA